MKGRKPKPTEVKTREGNPGKRPLGDPVLVGDRIVLDEDVEIARDGADVLEGEIVPADAGPPAAPAWLPPVPEIIALADALALTAPDYVLDVADRDVPGYGTVFDLYEQTIGSYAGARLWRDVIELLAGSGILSAGDLYAVEEFVVATLEARRAFLELRATGAIQKASNPKAGRAGDVRAVAFRNFKDANGMMLKWAEQLGLSPVARSRLGLAIAQGRKLTQELEAKLPENPLARPDADTTARTLDPLDDD